jgi:uncharacterized membrane protein YkvA (DUF1232 family)
MFGGMMPMLQGWQERGKQLREKTYAVYLASGDDRVPWYAKGLILFLVLHTLSPIDLIPDFIPILGYLDDLIIVPLGIALALRMIPDEVMAECRRKARLRMNQDAPKRWMAGAVIVVTWLIAIALTVVAIWRVVGD